MVVADKEFPKQGCPPPPPLSSARRLLRKYRRSRLRQLRCKEYNRLRAMVPSIAAKPKVSKVTVIEEAIKYIDQLHSALIARLQNRGLPQSLQGVFLPQEIHHISKDQLKDLVHRMMPQSHQNILSSISLATPACERTRSTASYLQRLQKKRQSDC